MQKINFSSKKAQPTENATTKLFDAPLFTFTASSASADNTNASGSGPRYDVAESSGMNSKKMFSLKASDKIVSMSA